MTNLRASGTLSGMAQVPDDVVQEVEAAARAYEDRDRLPNHDRHVIALPVLPGRRGCVDGPAGQLSRGGLRGGWEASNR